MAQSESLTLTMNGLMTIPFLAVSWTNKQLQALLVIVRCGIRCGFASKVVVVCVLNRPVSKWGVNHFNH